MNFLEPSATGSGRFDRPPENIDGLLSAFFQAEVPSPWPEMRAPASGATETAPAKPRVRSLEHFARTATRDQAHRPERDAPDCRGSYGRVFVARKSIRS